MQTQWPIQSYIKYIIRDSSFVIAKQTPGLRVFGLLLSLSLLAVDRFSVWAVCWLTGADRKTNHVELCRN